MLIQNISSKIINFIQNFILNDKYQFKKIYKFSKNRFFTISLIDQSSINYKNLLNSQ